MRFSVASPVASVVTERRTAASSPKNSNFTPGSGAPVSQENAYTIASSPVSFHASPMSVSWSNACAFRPPSLFAAGFGVPVISKNTAAFRSAPGKISSQSRVISFEVSIGLPSAISRSQMIFPTTSWNGSGAVGSTERPS